MTEAPRQIESRDLDWVLTLNREHETELSPLTPLRLKELVAVAVYAKALDPQAAFLLAFDQDASYDSPNFLWFQDCRTRFVYVDRITVSPEQRGRGHARTLYDDLFASALALGHERIVCEVNSDPPNPGSDAFHAALGFREVGRAELADRGKSVRYLERALV